MPEAWCPLHTPTLQEPTSMVGGSRCELVEVPELEPQEPMELLVLTDEPPDGEALEVPPEPRHLLESSPSIRFRSILDVS